MTRKKRPRGKAVRIDVNASRCPRCGSAERTPYHRIITRPISGELPTGELYQAITWRRTNCGSCGQARVERTYETVPVPLPAA